MIGRVHPHLGPRGCTIARRRAGLLLVLTLGYSGCQPGSTTGPPPAQPPPAPPPPPASKTPSSMTVAAGDGQTGPVGTVLPTAPSVRVMASDGSPISGVSVGFAVGSGGGQVTGSPVETDAQGIARVGSWTLGATPEINTLLATTSGLDPVTFMATATVGAPSSMSIQSGDGQTATVGTTVPTAPSVRVTDAAGNPVPDVEVAFSVSSGGGTLEDATVTTDADGIAAAGGWTLGVRAGVNELTAVRDGIEPVTFTATGVAGVPALVLAIAGDGQTAAAGSQVPVAPAVRVEDAYANPVAGVDVDFEITSGSGSILGANTTTDAAGVAAVGGWTLGSGTNSLTASVDLPEITGNPVVFSAAATTAGPAYDVEVRYNSGTNPTSSQEAAFAAAAARWEGIITADLPDVPIDIGPGICGSGSPAVNETVDDMVIFVTLTTIDGPGGILGQAGPCMIRTLGGLPLMGLIEFDTADLADLESAGLLDDVILHEMGHVLGVGGMWDFFGLLADPSLSGGLDPYFTGSQASEAFDAAGGAGYAGNKVPVEDTGGPGTADSHWRESVLDKELMTGFVDSGFNPLSAITIRSLADMGYTVNAGEADAFSISSSLRAGSRGTKIPLRDDLLRLPVYSVDSDGRITGLRLR